MEILQQPISADHKSSMFFNGVIAYGKAKSGNTFVLTTEGESEISMNGQNLFSENIIKLGLSFLIDDEVLEEESGIDILVDNWFVIAQARGTDIEDILYAEDQDEDRIFDNYDEAIEGFEEFLSKS